MSNYADALRRSGPGGDEQKKKNPVPVAKPQQTQNPDAGISGDRKFSHQPPVKSLSAPEGATKHGQHVPPGVSKAARKAPESSKSPSKNSKKPKPKLKNMSLGDLIDSKLPSPSQRPKPPPAVSSETTILKKPPEAVPAPAPAQAVVSSSFQMDDFPSLAAAVHQPSETTKPSSLPAGASWGSKLKQAKVKKELNMRQEKKAAPAAAKITARKAKVKIEEPPPKSIMDSFVAKQRTDDGREHDLLKLMQEGKIKTQKGRQRVTPRRKKFTTLKKKVLEERLRRWKETHPEEVDAKSRSEEPTSMQVDSDLKVEHPSCTVCLTGFARAEELEDEDEYEEILANLREMAEKVGTVKDVFVPRPDGGDDCPVYVLFSKTEEAAAATSCWDGLVVGGQILAAAAIDLGNENESIDGPMGNQWRASISSYGSKSGASIASGPVVVRLENILTDDDLDDHDCLQETLNDVRSMLEKFGPVNRIDVERDSKAVVVTFGDPKAAQSAQSQLDGAVIGGNLITASLLDTVDTAGSSTPETSCCTVALQNAITQDDLDDEDNMEESLRDIRILAEKFGVVRDVQVNRHEYVVLVSFEGPAAVAKHAADQLNGISLGGQPIIASILEDRVTSSGPVTSWVYLYNLLTEDDIEDPDSLEETKRDVAELAGQFGTVVSVEVEAGESGHLVKVGYEGDIQVSQHAADKLNEIVFGGQSISAVAVSGSNDANGEHVAAERSSVVIPEAVSAASVPAAEPEKEPLYSGDKLIPDRFAEAKRVPKISETQGSRHYATVIDDGAVKPLLIEMLGELMRLQKRAVEEKNVKARRRLVMGLREVARGIRSNKVKMVVMANNLDDYGVIDDKLQEILDLARAQDVPVFFEFNKRHLGKAIGKNIKIGVIGIQNAEGAHQQFKQLSSMARKHGL